MNFKPRNFHTSPLYMRLNILKLPDKILFENWLLISKAINNFLPSPFNDWSTFASETHHYETFSSTKGLLKILSINNGFKLTFQSCILKNYEKKIYLS